MNSTPLFVYDCIDSTSDQAFRLLKQQPSLATDVKPPFAVLARQQTAGRGRYGKKWHSAPEGLYLSLVLPAEKNKNHLVWYPVRSAIVLALWLKKFFSIHSMIKWPNDIWWQGGKCAGILCEVNHCGDDISPLVVGLGINLRNTLEGDFPYRVRHVQSPFLEGKSVEELATSLLMWWSATWPVYSDSEKIKETFWQFIPKEGQYWIHRQTGEKYFVDHLVDNGSLVLSGVRHKHEKFTLTSASHPFMLAPPAEKDSFSFGAKAVDTNAGVQTPS